MDGDYERMHDQQSEEHEEEGTPAMQSWRGATNGDDDEDERDERMDDDEQSEEGNREEEETPLAGEGSSHAYSVDSSENDSPAGRRNESPVGTRARLALSVSEFLKAREYAGRRPPKHHFARTTVRKLPHILKVSALLLSNCAVLKICCAFTAKSSSLSCEVQRKCSRICMHPGVIQRARAVVHPFSCSEKPWHYKTQTHIRLLQLEKSLLQSFTDGKNRWFEKARSNAGQLIPHTYETCTTICFPLPLTTTYRFYLCEQERELKGLERCDKIFASAWLDAGVTCAHMHTLTFS